MVVAQFLCTELAFAREDRQHPRVAKQIRKINASDQRASDARAEGQNTLLEMKEESRPPSRNGMFIDRNNNSGRPAKIAGEGRRNAN